MKRISSAQTFFVKKVIPVIWLLVVVLIITLAAAPTVRARQPSFFVLPLVPLVMLVAGIFYYRYAIRGLADEVYPFAKNPTAEDLIVRMDAARRASVRR